MTPTEYAELISMRLATLREQNREIPVDLYLKGIELGLIDDLEDRDVGEDDDYYPYGRNDGAYANHTPDEDGVQEC